MFPFLARYWQLLLAVVLAAVAGFFWLLTFIPPVRGPEDLATVEGMVGGITHDRTGAIIIRLREQQRPLTIYAGDQPLLDMAAFERHVRPGSYLVAQVFEARNDEGVSWLVVLGLREGVTTYLSLEQALAVRRHESLVVFPSIAATLTIAACAAAYFGVREQRRQRQRAANRFAANSYRVSMRSVQLLGGIIVLQFGFFATGAMWQGEQLIALGFLAFAGLGVVLLVTSPTIELDEIGIVCRAPFNRRELTWSELRLVMNDPEQHQLVLRGASQQIVVSGFRYWNGEESLAAQQFFVEQLDRRKIPTKARIAALVQRRSKLEPHDD